MTVSAVATAIIISIPLIGVYSALLGIRDELRLLNQTLRLK